MRAVLLLLVSASAFAQNTGMTARQLYLGAAPPPAKPAATQAQPQANQVTKRISTPRPKPTTAQATTDPNQTAAQPTDNSIGSTQIITASNNASNNGPSPFMPVAFNLGVRYNILAVDRDSGAAHEVEANSNFKTGDCLAIRLTPNRGGFLYLFNAGTSGAWTPLLPSPKMPDESNRITSHQNAKFPKDNCFGVNGPPGTDRLVVVMTERQEDQEGLSNAIRRSSEGGDKNIAADPASSPLGQTIMAMAGSPGGNGLASRDLSVESVAQASSGEPPYSVYIVKTSAQMNDRIVFDIQIRHE